MAESTRVRDRPAPAARSSVPSRSASAEARSRQAERRLAEVTELPAPQSAGRPLDAQVQQSLSARLGHDLSRIRLHHDWFAAELAEALDAQAVMHGDDAYFGRDAADPWTPAGRALLVHELFHSVEGGLAGHQFDEVAAERAAVAASRDDLTSVPLHPGDRSRTSADVDPAIPIGRLGRLGRRAKGTLVRGGAPGEQIPDVVSAGEALVRLVERLFSRDPEDRGGRLAGVLGRLEHSLREAVITTVADRNGGHTRASLTDLAGERPPEDGGQPAPDASRSAAPEADASRPAAPEAAAEEGREATAEAAEPVTAEAAAEGAAASADAPAASATATATAKPTAVGTTEESAGTDTASGESAAEQPPATAAIDAPAAQLPPAAGSSVGGGIGARADTGAAPVVSSGGDAPVAVAEPSDVGPATDAPGGGATPGTAEEESAETSPDEAPVPAPDSVAETGVPADADSRAESSAGGELSLEPEPTSGADATVEPADPPAITDPPDAAEDAAPTLPEAPAPIEDPAAPGAEAHEQPEAVEATEADLNGADDAADSTVGADGEGSGEGGPEAAADPAELAAPAAADAEPVLTDPPAPSGGGGGGAAIADPPEPDAPDVSAMAPQAALGAVASLPATKLAANLGNISASASREVSEGQADLAANPPAMERPSGVPADRDASLPPAPLPTLPVAADRTLAPIVGGPGAQPPAPAPPPPAPAPVTLRVPEAKAGGDTQISAEDAARIQTAVKALPTTDPALDVDAGPVPELELTGAEDPQQVGTQADQVEGLTAGAQTDGLADARADMGENGVLPQVPKETLAADVSGGGSSGEAGAAGAAPAPTTAPERTPAAAGVGGVGGAAGGGGGAAIPDRAIDAIAAEQGGDQIGAATQAQGGALGAARTDHESSVEQAKADTDEQINDEIAGNGAEQTEARRGVRAEVGNQRKAWVGDQDKIVGESRAAAGAASKQADEAVTQARTTARTDATRAIKDGNADIAKERGKAETKAREEREKAEKESNDGGFFSWLGSKVKSFIDSVKSVIHAAFELARKAVDAVISTVQKLAVAAIEIGRKAVVAAIEIGGKALAAAGDIVLAGFPEARDRFRARIKEEVAGATKAVNELADSLKAGVKKLLDGLGKLLKGALSLLEKAYTAAIDVVGKVVVGVIKAAKAWVDALIDFAVLVADIASSPGQWLSNLGSSLLDGVRNHVWPALVKAVKGWFKSKVEDVVGVGAMILDLLRKGGITFGKIVTMAWTAIKESLPGILIQLLIEKLVAMLIPAGGALSLIIDGIKAAWGAASKILAAFQKFIAFLKAVKAGNAGRQFGDLVAAAAVAVMDFLANFVLSKLKGAGQKVGGTLRKMADRIMKTLKKVAGAVKKGAKAAAGLVKKGAKAAAGLVKKGAKAVGGLVKKVMPKNMVALGRKMAKKVAGAVKKGVDKVKQGYQKAKEKLLGKGKKGSGKKKETKQEKLERAISRTKQTIGGLLAKGVSRLRLWATLAWLKRRWGWKRLERRTTGPERSTIQGVINPPETVGESVSSIVILFSGTPVPVGTVPAATPTPHLSSVPLGPSTGILSKQYPQAMTQRELRSTATGVRDDRPSRIAEIAREDIGRDIRVTEPSGRKAGGRSSRKEARVNLEMDIRKGDKSLPFVRPDARTLVVGGVDALTGKPDPARDAVHLYEITTMLDFVEGNQTHARHKQSQAVFTLDRALAAYPTAKLHYTFIAPELPTQATVDLIQGIVLGLIAKDPSYQHRFTVTWRAIGGVRRS